MEAEAEEAPGTASARRCALTRASRPKSDLIRFVLSPDGEIVPDLREKLPGRGVWVTAAEDAVAEARKKNVFARSLKTPAKVPGDLAERIGRMLNEAALKAFSLANKAGEVTFGFVKIEEALKKGRVTALIHASDASDDGSQKLDRIYRAVAAEAAMAPIAIFSGHELSLASGRPNVIHAALTEGGAAAKFIAAASRAERYRLGSGTFEAQNEPDTEQG